VERRLDLKAFSVTVFLLFCGLLVLYSASAPFSLRHYGSDTYMLLKQLIAAAAGIAVLAFFGFFDYHRLAAIDNLLLIGAFGLTLLTILPVGIGEGRWLFIGPFAVQPTEFLKFSLIVYLASTLDRKGEAVRSFSEGILPFVVVLGLIGAVVLNQPDLGMLLVYGGVTVVLLFLAGAPLRHLAAIIAGSIPFLFLAIRLEPYRFARILSFFDPRAYSTSSGYQTIQSLIAVGSGGLLGRGNDFIFSVAAEELGFFGVIFILGLVAILVWRAFVISEGAKDRLGRLLALGIGFTIAFQTILNTGVALGVLPVTGLTFPFFSNGGSSLLVTLAMIGVLLNVSRQGVRG